jgi:phage tail P2-like protein
MPFQSLLPQFEKVELHCLDEFAYEIFKRLNEECAGLKTMLNPKECNSKFLPFLAYENAVDFWGDNLSEQEKRNLISSSKELKRKKGTLYAVEKVLEQFNITASVQEWWSYGGDAYHFKIDIESIGIAYSAQDIKTLENYVNVYKNVRSVLDSINVTASIDAANIFIGTSTSTYEVIEVELVA